MGKLRFLLVLSLFVGCGSTLGSDDPSRASARTENDCVKRFLNAVKANPDINSIDLTMIREVISQPESEEQIRHHVNAVFNQSEQGAVYTEDQNPEARKAEIEAEVQHISRLQQQPRMMKQRLRTAGYCYRLDQTILSDDLDLDITNDYASTYINFGDAAQGNYDHCYYDHTGKSVTVWNSLPMWVVQQVTDAGRIPESLAGFLDPPLSDVAMSKPEERQSPSENGIVAKYKHAGINMTARPVAEGSPRRDRFDVTLMNKTLPHWSFDCDAIEYSRVYSCRRYDSQTRVLRWQRECSEFDEKGFPHNISIQQFDEEGDLAKDERIAILSVRVNPSLSQHIFQPSLPTGYIMIDRRMSPPMIVEEIPQEVFELDSGELEAYLNPLSH